MMPQPNRPENAAASPWADRVHVHRMDVRRMRSTDANSI
jgi:tRNA1(Val) A37 N6-methylase TrmN6